jgi:hypothetical protein
VSRWLGMFAIVLIACSILASTRAEADENSRPHHNWELAAGFTPLSYGFYDALGGDGHFDQFTTLPAAGLELGANYLQRRYLAFGVTAAYVFSLGRTDYWSRSYEPGVHRFRGGPQVQFRMPGDSVEPFVNLSGGLSALASKNYGGSYNAVGFYGSLGLGGNIHFTSRFGMYARYNLTFDHTTVQSMDADYGTDMEGVPVLAFLQEVTVGLLIRL